MKKSRVLDDVDLNIMDLLRENPRTTKKSIAQSIGLSETTVGIRIDRLSRSNIMRVVAQREMLSQGFRLIYLVNVFSQHRSIDDIAADIAAIGDTLTVSIMLGTPEIVVTVFGKTPESIYDSILNRIIKVPGVHRFEAQILSDIIKIRSDFGELATALPQIADADTEVDLDTKILSHLSTNGLSSNREIASRFLVSESLVRTRINRMIESKSVRFAVICDHSVLNLPVVAQIFLRVSYTHIRASCEILAELPGVAFLATLSGPHNVTLTVYSESTASIAEFCNEQIRAITGVEDVFVRLIVRHVKHRYDLIRSPDYNADLS